MMLWLMAVVLLTVTSETSSLVIDTHVSGPEFNRSMCVKRNPLFSISSKLNPSHSMYANTGLSVHRPPNVIDVAETTTNKYDSVGNQSLDDNDHQNHSGVAATELGSSNVLTKRAISRPLDMCPPPSRFQWSMCLRDLGLRAYTVACKPPWAYIDGECSPQEFCVNGILPNMFAPGPLPNFGKAYCVSHQNILRFVQASNSVTEKYETSGLGQLGLKWHSDAIGGDLYVKLHTAL